VVSWAEQNAFNTSLCRVVRSQQRRDRGVKRSNNGGWHWTPNFFRTPAPEVEELERRVFFALSAAYPELGTPAGRRRLSGWRLKGWANVTRRGQWNGLHYHGRAALTGIYYVKVGSPSRSPRVPGHLALYDLEQLKKWNGVGDLPAGTRTHRILPVPGTMVLFPGQMWHSTDVFSGPGERVSIAFNIRRIDAPNRGRQK
jgi:putative 2-oxoglutarate-Fe(II)-dependent oxygenase superfamily protein